MGRRGWLDLFKDKWKKNPVKFTKEDLMTFLDKDKIPQHVAIIMDGNGRWAQSRGLPRVAGHRAGVESIRDVVKLAKEIGIKVLTLYAFSTENWKRSNQEVSSLMKLLQEFLRKETHELHKENIRITAVGNLDKLPSFAYQELQNSIKLTEKNDRLVLNLALNYGARQEIVEAVAGIAGDIQKGRISIQQIDEELFSSYLSTKGLPDPELLIRTSGELRLSNFLLWQLAYTEFWITSIYWPDFREIHLLEAILAYQKRDRRFGGINL